MADVIANKIGVETAVAATNRYIFGDAEVGFAAQIVFTLDLNTGTITCAPQARVRGSDLWVTCLAVPKDSTTGATSLTGANTYVMDASGCECALNVTASSGAPVITWTAVTG